MKGRKICDNHRLLPPPPPPPPPPHEFWVSRNEGGEGGSRGTITITKKRKEMGSSSFPLAGGRVSLSVLVVYRGAAERR